MKVTVVVLDINDHAPQFLNSIYNVTLNEVQFLQKFIQLQYTFKLSVILKQILILFCILHGALFKMNQNKLLVLPSNSVSAGDVSSSFLINLFIRRACTWSTAN